MSLNNMSLAFKIGTYEAPTIPGFRFNLEKDSLGTIISALIPYLFVFAGLLLFVYLIIGGFSYLTSGGEPKAMEQAKGKVTNAIIGFIIIFIAYWVVQIFHYIFKIPGGSF